MSDQPTPGRGQNDLGYEQPPAAGACGPSPGVDGWHDCAVSKIRQIERLRSFVGPAFEDNPNTEAVIEAAIAALQDPVDWQARSQGLEAALDRPLRMLEGLATPTPSDPFDAERLLAVVRAAVGNYTAQVRRALSLGLPDEEGECHEDIGSDPCCKPTVGERLDPTHGGAYPVCAEHLRPPFPDSAYGAAPPPRGPAVQGADAEIPVRKVRADGFPHGIRDCCSECQDIAWESCFLRGRCRYYAAVDDINATSEPKAAGPEAVRPINRGLFS